MATGREDRARATMESIAFVRPEITPRKQVPLRSLTAIYDRDRYLCRYCGRATVCLPVLRMMSGLFPQQFPFHPNWKADSCHPAYSEISTSNDHVVPVSRGGDSLDETNIVTSCAGCNYRKSDLLLEHLGMTLQPIEHNSAWRGLADMYRPLWEAAGQPTLSTNDKTWMRLTDALYRET
ncbi:HNH endonuclease [Streptomyces sp. NBC_01465]|uniref:HNH endonuclease n=1 Tax=Streptomyces sp. NBC_01465 TaxID=2903878 RepID=UPI002E320FCE|nr:HNH endonuclease [Streptomyces sp. NBC_01465]